ncbi:MAG: phage portal protein [Clostridiales bacterium]|nr:phage portal protein [Clostridiales bacterium]
MNIPAFASSVAWVANKVAALPIKLYTENSGKASEITDDCRLVYLNDASYGDTMTAAEMKYGMVRDYLLYGRSYAYIDWNFNTVRGLHYVNAADVSYNEPLSPIFRSTTYYIDGKEYAAYELLRLCRHTTNGVSGSSIIDENPELLGIAYYSMQFEKKLILSGGCRKAYIKADKTLTKAMFEELKESWRRLFTLDGDAAIAINAGAEVKEASSSPVELQMNENKRMNSEQIYELFGLSEEVVKGQASDEQLAHAVQNAVIPITTAFESMLNRNLLLESEKGRMYFAFDLKELLKGDIEKRYRAYQIALQTNFMQLDEVRYAEDLPPLGFNFIKLGLNDVLFDPKSKTVYTPNTNAVAELDHIADGSDMVDESAEARADNDRYIQGKDGKMNGSRPKNDGDGVDKNEKSGIIKSNKVKLGLQYFSEKDIVNQDSNSLKRSIRKFQKRIAEHEGYILNPKEHCPDWDNFSDMRKSGLKKHWNKEISNFKESIDNRVTELKKRGDYDE